MCTVCGCDKGETTLEGGHDHDHPHHDHPHHDHDHDHDHSHDHDHDHDHSHHHHHDHGPGHSHRHRRPPPGSGDARLLRIEQDILAKNDGFASVNRQLFAAKGILALNLMSSPGAGKTTLLVRTLTELRGRRPMAVIEGDQQTSFDADRIRATGTQAIQINTGKGCHLDAQMVTQAVGRLDPAHGSVLYIENVGNLVCPAGFDLGEARKVVVLSVTEGEDKPLKYPNMFASADLLLVNKIDLLPHLTFDVTRMIDYARRLKPELEVIEVSAASGQGMDRWYAWIESAAALAARSLG
jgi:hydrogenase nickel incorporation protein HypB